MIQTLWSEKIAWDETIPASLHSEWLYYRDQLCNINSIEVHRHFVCHNPVRIDMHGFCDASQQAYGACIYILSEDENGSIYIHLVTAKSKVAPLKSQSIPRLELCSALILARLQKKVTDSITIEISNFYFWSDSKIVLSWIKTPANILKTFVANRVDEIQTLTKHGTWQHVASKDNPADLISRGANPSILKSSNLWWRGPSWLLEPKSNWLDHSYLIEENIPEQKTNIQCFKISKIDNSFLFRFSSFSKLKRVIAYCLRFKYNTLKQNQQFGPFTTEELQDSTYRIVKLVQLECFAEEIHNLKHGQPLSSKSKITNLHPFIDNHDIIRVGGRISLAYYSYDKSHPILLPKSHYVVELLFKYEHERLSHAGQQQLLYSVRETYWPILGRNTARKIVHQCVRCHRIKPRFITPMLGNLPANRIEASLPFIFTGVDYAGPFMIRDKKGRGFKLQKAYICLFVCYSSKAIHLELVSDLTKEAFIASLRRFVSRRGRPAEIHSDNGTNFVGANNELQELSKFLQQAQEPIVQNLAQDGIKWKFIPPHSPHFGGLWEAGVKSAKFHIKRVMGNAQLTFEEFYTLLTQIESVLNSRPLTPMSSDPNDLLPICPSHFLIGRSLTSVVNPDVRHIPDNRLSNYQRLQQLQQHFWQRWSREYISELQARRKNTHDRGTVKLGDLVLIKDDNTPSLCWQLGRITQLYPGKDGRVRVVALQTSKGVIQRAVTKVCPLPLQEQKIVNQCA